jgi:hypothetical protein
MRTLYLDTNVIGFLKDNSIENSRLIDRISSSFECYFSNYNLLEFLNCPTSESITSQIEVLIRLNAKLLLQSFDYSNNTALDHFDIFNVDIYEYLNTLTKESSHEVGKIVQSMQIRDLHHFHGGMPKSSPIDLANSKFTDISRLNNYNKENIKSLCADITDDDRKTFLQSFGINFDQYISDVFKHMDDMEFEYLRILSKSVSIENQTPTEIFIDKCKSLRNDLDLRNLNLNQIKGPSIVQKVCDRLRSQGHYVDSSDEELMAVDKNYIRPGQPLHIHEKIVAILSQLNSFGFRKDEKLKKFNKVRAHSFDFSHATIAGTVEYFCCDDAAFSDRLKATFEYLNIRTKVVSLSELIKLTQ